MGNSGECARNKVEDNFFGKKNFKKNPVKKKKILVKKKNSKNNFKTRTDT